MKSGRSLHNSARARARTSAPPPYSRNCGMHACVASFDGWKHPSILSDLRRGAGLGECVLFSCDSIHLSTIQGKCPLVPRIPVDLTFLSCLSVVPSLALAEMKNGNVHDLVAGRCEESFCSANDRF